MTMPGPSGDILLRRLGISVPLLLAPMAGGVAGAALAAAVARAGGLGAIAAATLGVDALRAEVRAFRAAIDAPLNLNFFAHRDVPPTAGQVERWRAALAPLHAERGLVVPTTAVAGRRPFDADAAALVEALRPEVVSFHFGLPDDALLDRVRATGAALLSTATTVAEARWLAARGVDAVIVQGWEAGGHRGMFLGDDIGAQVGLFALLSQVVDAVDVPVIAAGGIADARGFAASRALGAAAVQVGTAFLRSDEATTPGFQREALAAAGDDATRLTNVYTGRPARGLATALMQRLGPMSVDALPFPYAGALLAALRDADPQWVAPIWSGQAAALAAAGPAADIVRAIAGDAGTADAGQRDR